MKQKARHLGGFCVRCYLYDTDEEARCCFGTCTRIHRASHRCTVITAHLALFEVAASPRVMENIRRHDETCMHVQAHTDMQILFEVSLAVGVGGG